VQRLNDLIGLTAQHAAARDGEDRRPFIDQLRGLGDAMARWGRGQGVGDATLGAAGKRLKEFQTTTPPTDLTDGATAAHEALRARFPDLKPFPTMEEGAATAPEENIIAADEAESAAERARAAAVKAEGEAGGTAPGGNGGSGTGGAAPTTPGSTTPQRRAANPEDPTEPP
jgi:hypothetical protein